MPPGKGVNGAEERMGFPGGAGLWAEVESGAGGGLIRVGLMLASLQLSSNCD